MQQVSSTGSQPETGRYFIGDKHSIVFVCNFPDTRKKPGVRLMIPDWFQDYGRKFTRVASSDCLQFLCMIGTWNGRAVPASPRAHRQGQGPAGGDRRDFGHLQD